MESSPEWTVAEEEIGESLQDERVSDHQQAVVMTMTIRKYGGTWYPQSTLCAVVAALVLADLLARSCNLFSTLCNSDISAACRLKRANTGFFVVCSDLEIRLDGEDRGWQNVLTTSD